MLRRRGFFGLAAGLLMAPSVVKASSIMPVRAFDPNTTEGTYVPNVSIHKLRIQYFDLHGFVHDV